MSGRRLSERQRQRIRQIQDKRKKRLEQRVDEALDDSGAGTPREGRVITRHGVNLAVEDLEGTLTTACSGRTWDRWYAATEWCGSRPAMVRA
jgi:ribosome biogenesis GTPase